MAGNTPSSSVLTRRKQARSQLQQQLRQPDELQRWSARAYEAVRERLPQVAAAVVGLALVCVAFSIYSRVAATRDAAATAAFARAQKLHAAPLLPEGADRPAPSADEPNPVPRFKSAKERSEATLKELDALRATYGGSDVAQGAMLMRGGVLLELSRFDEAAKAYTELVGSSELHLRLLAREGLIYAVEGKGDRARALTETNSLAEVAAKGPGFFRDRALFHEARLRQGLGDGKAALALFKQLVDKYPASQLRDEAQDRIAVLETK